MDRALVNTIAEAPNIEAVAIEKLTPEAAVKIVVKKIIVERNSLFFLR